MEIRRIGVVGAGTMGRGIAEVAAVAGFSTTLMDADAGVLAKAREGIERSTSKAVDKGKLDAEARAAALERIVYVREIEALAASDLLIEAIPEDPDLKRQVFVALAGICGPQTLFATNTSSISIDTLAPASGRPDRFLGMHFFNPVPVMKLVEVVRGGATSPQTIETVCGVARTLGKTAIVVGDSPGFATSRLGVVLGLEAIRMLEAGVASAADIDTAMELGYNHPVGPLKLTDIVGLDVRLAIAEYLHRAFGGAQYEPPNLLRRMVGEKKLGKKSGEGFYKWEEGR